MAHITIEKVGRKRIAQKPCAQCGQVIKGQLAIIRRRRFCSMSCAGLAETGELHRGWKGGSKYARARFITSRAYSEWRKAVLVRDMGRCRWCDAEGIRSYRKLQVHHIIPLVAYLEGAAELNNGIALCVSHHDLTRGRENQYAEFLSGLLGQALTAPPMSNRKDRVPLRATKQVLEDLYLKQRFSTNAIGRLFNVTGACVLKYLRMYGIPRRSQSEARAGIGKHSALSYTVARLHQEGYTARQLEAQLHIGRQWAVRTAAQWMSKPFDYTAKARGLTGNVARRLLSTGWTEAAICRHFKVNVDQIRRAGYAGSNYNIGRRVSK